MTTKSYNEEFKHSAVKALLLPGSQGLIATARKFDLPPSTLYTWKKKYGRGSPMKKSKKIESYIPEQKLNIVIKTASMSEQELGEWIRTQGLNSSDLETMRDECLPSLTKALDVAFVSTTENLDTNTPLGVATFSIISSISQLERDLIRERVVNGLKAAKERGVEIGRKKTRPSAFIRRLRSKGLTYRKIAELSNGSQGSVALEIRQWEEENAKGIERSLDDEINTELIEPIEQKPTDINEEEGIPPLPIPVVRF